MEDNSKCTCDGQCSCESQRRESALALEKEFIKFTREKPGLRTSDVYKTINLPVRFDCPYLFNGYGIQRSGINPFYKTVNSEYGFFTPNAHTVPTRFFPRGQKFSNDLAKGGMYRNYSLNTQMDHSFY